MVILSLSMVDIFLRGRLTPVVLNHSELNGLAKRGAAPETALRDTQAVEFSYHGTPNNLASHDPGKLKVLRQRGLPSFAS